jgi:hypothetical protein
LVATEINCSATIPLLLVDAYRTACSAGARGAATDRRCTSLTSRFNFEPEKVGRSVQASQRGSTALMRKL